VGRLFNAPSENIVIRRVEVLKPLVWHFRAWRKSFSEWFGISAHGESRFPKGLAFPRLAKVVSRRVWHFRAWRKLFPERFEAFATWRKVFPKGFEVRANRLFIKR